MPPPESLLPAHVDAHSTTSDDTRRQPAISAAMCRLAIGCQAGGTTDHKRHIPGTPLSSCSPASA
jgi:hypothetical protein